MTAQQLANNTRIGQYEIQKRLGQGGMAEVYLAQDIGLERLVAIKAIHAEHANEQAFLDRFRREARAMAKLLHPNIVQIYTLLEEAGRLYLVMQYVEGETLDQRLKTLREQNAYLAPSEATQIIATLCEAAHYAHRAGMVHRDIKPANVMLLKDTGTPVLMDFGVAKVSGATSLTRTNALTGTPKYMSPEQLAENSSIDARTDIYSLGMVFYEMMAGVTPFEVESFSALVYKIMLELPPSPRKYNLAIPEKLEKIVLKALEKEPDRRYNSAHEMAEALQLALAPSPSIRGPGHTAPLTPPELDPYQGTEKLTPVPVRHSNLKKTREIKLLFNLPIKQLIPIILQEGGWGEFDSKATYTLWRGMTESQTPLDETRSLAEQGMTPGDSLVLAVKMADSTPTVSAPCLVAPTGQVFPLNKSNVFIGRSHASTGVVEVDLSTLDASRSVHRRHAQILRRDNGFVIVDLGGENGVLVNGVELPRHGRRPLQSGDTIELGDVSLKFSAPVGSNKAL